MSSHQNHRMNQQQQQPQMLKNKNTPSYDDDDDVDEHVDHEDSDDGDGSASDAYIDIHTAVAGGDSTVVTAANILLLHHPSDAAAAEGADATDCIQETHLALLYLLSFPDEFEKAVRHAGFNHNNTGTTLAQWNAADLDNESLYTEAESTILPNQASLSSGRKAAPEAAATTTSGARVAPPLPYAVFCDDAEVVLPQAHTASQLFGIETIYGMELEAAAGVPALSQLFLRWLALMPGGDHLNLIDPPGLTVMKIAGGRYRVTAAHKVVWTWMNEFASLLTTTTTSHKTKNQGGSNLGNHHKLQVGDLVSMTIIDVFETDNQGKLLSYCPTFDNRRIVKTDRTAHAIRKQTAHVRSVLQDAQNSKLAKTILKHVSKLASTVKQTVDDAVHNYNNSNSSNNAANNNDNSIDDEDNPENGYKEPRSTTTTKGKAAAVSTAGTSAYLGDDDMERHEV